MMRVTEENYEHDACGIGAVVDIKGRKSHSTVSEALGIVERLEHRAGKDAEGKTGDGVGIMLQVSHSFFVKAAAECGISLPGEREYGVGMFFFPQTELKCRQAKKLFEIVCGKEGLKFLGWRKVPVESEILGSKALSVMPEIYQGFVAKPEDVLKGLEFDRKLYVARRLFEQASPDTYVVSCSSRTIVYKGMFLVDQLRGFFTDLKDPDMDSAIALVHSRFSTNTNPSWMRAHPNRLIVHNGEINTIKGNADKMRAREEVLAGKVFEGEMAKILPVVNDSGSDSAMLDNTLEFLMMSGMPLPLAVMTLIPEPWIHDKSISEEKKDFYQYYATMMEPWDGPASILFSDGDVMGAVLDRNGLRPSRYYITNDDLLVLASEVGVMNVPQEKIIKKDRLRPGRMLLVDTVKGEVIEDEKIKSYYSGRAPYGEWLDGNLTELKNLHIPNKRIEEYTKEERERLYRNFGYTYENIMKNILPMAENGGEAVLAMGADLALPSLSKQYPPLFDYFRQLFAQVTNPPLDAIREEIVTGTTMFLGKAGNLLEEKPENCRMLRINNPILTDTDILKIKSLNKEGLKAETVPIIYYKNSSLKKAIERLYVLADNAIKAGATILILSDRGVDEYHVAIPSLLAVSALQQYLVRTKKRTALSLILESAEPREVHHFATLIGFGASAVNPYLAHEVIREKIEEHLLDKDYYAAVDDYNSAVLHGIVKIASKMGISTLQSYQGAKIFEAIGISKEVVDEYFTGVISRVGGLGLSDIEAGVEALHNAAFDQLGLYQNMEISSTGMQKERSGKEKHLYNPQTIHMLQLSTHSGSYEKFKTYTQMITDEEKGISLRGQIDFAFPENGGVPIEEVEPVSEIVKRFKTGAMSYGSISKEAHECLAIAMNKLGGKSNSGEGGESEERLLSKGSEEDRCSAIKQVASGRFGVTSRYLVSAREIQIKMAQGAKPGEGGQLPAGKVYPWIAKCRHSTPGVALISPPPHHDIYSIEDLAELIYDLKNANRDARISVKLVSEAGVGTIAAGVAKAGAEVILISGWDGGTGAAPKNSIYNAGLPWELGLSETHRNLIAQGLRNKVRIETDGKLMTGRDVAIACLLGAEEFGFATAPLVTLGCVMMRVCNLDTCPVGVATQNPELRKRFTGKPEYVMNFMNFIAEELREYMAKLGFRTIDEMVGHSELLKKRDTVSGDKAENLKLEKILDSSCSGLPHSHFEPEARFDYKLSETLDMKALVPALESYIKKPVRKARKQTLEISNTDRAFGTILGSEITKSNPEGLPEDSVVLECSGSAGQSFGAFIPKGLTIKVTGDANDYFGKGLSGGKLVLVPSESCPAEPSENIILGNVAFYGATSGFGFATGIAGERFCVRNSGMTAVVEGVGDHGCEYMTGGRAVILGETGKNFAAGMSGGVCYVLDEENKLYTRLNKTGLLSSVLSEKNDIEELKGILEKYYAETKSKKAGKILADFEGYVPKFKKIIPEDYKKMIEKTEEFMASGMSREDAEVEAFYANTRKE